MSQIILTPSAAPGTPSTGTLTVYSKTDKKLYWKDDTGTEFQVGNLTQVYGQRAITNNATVIAVTAAVDSTLNTNTDYIQVTGIWNAIPDGINSNVTQQTNSFTVGITGAYRIQVWANVTSSVNNMTIGLKFAINGTIAVGRRPKAFMGTLGDYTNVNGWGLTNLNAGDVVTLWMASDKTANITIQDCVFGVTEA